MQSHVLCCMKHWVREEGDWPLSLFCVCAIRSTCSSGLWTVCSISVPVAVWPISVSTVEEETNSNTLQGTDTYHPHNPTMHHSSASDTTEQQLWVNNSCCLSRNGKNTRCIQYHWVRWTNWINTSYPSSWAFLQEREAGTSCHKG